MKTIILECDDQDYDAIQKAIATRQQWCGGLPDGDGDVSARVVAEICRGWLERLAVDKAEDGR